MPVRNPKLTIAEHIALGRKIKLLDELKFEILNEVYRGYGVSCRAAKLAERIVKTDRLACEMDDLVIRETTYKEWSEKGYGSIYLGGEYENPSKHADETTF